VSSRRSISTLYSSPTDPHSHRTRIVLGEKGIDIEVIQVTPGRIPEDLIDINPELALPTLVDRELVVYDSRVIIEYLDERFPHPPLMPVDPVSRAQFRLALHRIERDWYGLLAQLDLEGTGKGAGKLRTQLRDMVVQTSDFFRAKPYFLSDEFSLVDASIAPVLWRLPHYGIELPKDDLVMQKYRARVFARPAFRATLSDHELEMRRA
jgi:RNA polymerase-associated protein